MLYLGDVLRTVRVLMQASDDTRRNANYLTWTDADLARWVDQAIQEYVVLNPRDWISVIPYTLTASAKQKLDPLLYLKVMSVDTKPATYPEWLRGIQRAEKNVIDQYYTAWLVPTGLPVDTTLYQPQLYALDPEDPLAFWLFPAPPAGAAVNVLAVSKPPALGYDNDSINIDLTQALYMPYYTRAALADYVMHRICAMEGDGAQSDDADFYYDQFRSRATGQWSMSKTMSEGQRVPPEAEHGSLDQ